MSIYIADYYNGVIRVGAETTAIAEQLAQAVEVTGNHVGDRIEVRQDPQGYQYGLILPEPGKRAFYRQKREGLNEFMEGEAERLDYDGRNDRVTLTGRAVMRRYRGAKLNDELSGHLIVYDNASERFTVDNVPAKGDAAGGSSSTNARVRAWLTPAPSGGASR